MNIVMIGMPGAGKSTVGVILAKTLGKNYIDTDLLIQEREKRLLQEILNEDGTAEFLRIEESVLLSIHPENSVVATGGSAVYSDAAMKHLKALGTVIYLKLPFYEIKNRLSNITTRGVVMSSGQSLLDIYEERVPLYEKYADMTVNCEGRSVEQTVAEIAERLSASHK